MCSALLPKSRRARTTSHPGCALPLDTLVDALTSLCGTLALNLRYTCARCCLHTIGRDRRPALTHTSVYAGALALKHLHCRPSLTCGHFCQSALSAGRTTQLNKLVELTWCSPALPFPPTAAAPVRYPGLPHQVHRRHAAGFRPRQQGAAGRHGRRRGRRQGVRQEHGSRI